MARHALLVGVSRFSDARLAALNAPASDLDALGAILRDPERGGFDSVSLSLDEDFMLVRERLSALFDGRDPDDFLLLYYSGHGILGRGNRLFLATPGSDLDRPQVRGLSAREIRDQMDQSRAERQVMVLDCCHSGAFAEGAKGAAATAITQETFDAGAAGRYVLAAADALQFAWDGDRLTDGEGERRTLSKFTSWIVDGLGSGEAAPQDEQITMDALFRYVSRRAKADGSPAVPQRYVDRDTGELVIGRNPAAAGPAWQEVLRQLEHDDWAVRAQAVEAAGRLLTRAGPIGRAAQDALDERLTLERDFKVRARIKELIGLDGGERGAPTSVAVPERLAARPEPSGGSVAEFKTGQSAPMREVYIFKEREIAVLNALGIAPDRWSTLPVLVVERVRLYARALQHTRWYLWTAVVMVFLDAGVLSNVHERTMDVDAAVMFAMWQIIVGAIGLLPIIKSIPPPTVAGYESVMARYCIVAFGRFPYVIPRMKQISVALIVTGCLTLVAAPALR